MVETLFVFDIDSNDGHKFTMATKDLNMAEYIQDMIDIGVASLKVEGRMRSHYYLATVISSYRKIIDILSQINQRCKNVNPYVQISCNSEDSNVITEFIKQKTKWSFSFKKITIL